MLIIEEKYLSDILNHAKDGAPKEVCGILAGRDSRVEKVFKMTNVSEKPEICYFMDSKEQFKIMKEIRSLRLEMLGIYHSHPKSEAYPSARDIELAYYADAVYVIVSLQDKNNPKVRAFRILENKIEEEKIG